MRAVSEAACGDERYLAAHFGHSGQAVLGRAQPSRSAIARVVAFKEHTMERAEKEQVLGEIKEAFANVAAVVIADYRGLKVPVVTSMRDDFRKAGCHYRVLKNSLVKIAIKGSKMEPMSTLMVGNTAV